MEPCSFGPSHALFTPNVHPFHSIFLRIAESLSGALGRISGALSGLHEATPAHGSCPRTWCGAWGRMVAVSGTCRGHISVHGTRTAVRQAAARPYRRAGAALDARKTDSAPGIKRSQHCLIPTDPPPRRLNDEPMPHTDAVTALPRGTVLRGRGRAGRRESAQVGRKRPRNAEKRRR